MYSPRLLEHFEHPRNVGELESPDATVETDNPACGDIMRLSLNCSDGRITQVRYRVRGCVAAIAAGSCLTELIHGRTLQEAKTIRREQLVAALGGLPDTSVHASHLAMDALTQALKQLTL